MDYSSSPPCYQVTIVFNALVCHAIGPVIESRVWMFLYNNDCRLGAPSQMVVTFGDPPSKTDNAIAAAFVRKCSGPPGSLPWVMVNMLYGYNTLFFVNKQVLLFIYGLNCNISIANILRTIAILCSLGGSTHGNISIYSRIQIEVQSTKLLSA